VLPVWLLLELARLLPLGQMAPARLVWLPLEPLLLSNFELRLPWLLSLCLWRSWRSWRLTMRGQYAGT
jgi:hypothetical protein